MWCYPTCRPWLGKRIAFPGWAICYTAYSFCCPTALQWLTKAKWTCASSSPELPGFLHLARKANYVGCSTRHLLRSTRTGEPPPPAYVERQSVMQLLLGVKARWHDPAATDGAAAGDHAPLGDGPLAHKDNESTDEPRHQPTYCANKQ